jgi:hypothetical protein
MSPWVLDTDIFIHALSADEPVRDAVALVRALLGPTGVASFSLVEFKGNYIQDLLLLSRKVRDSTSFSSCVARIQVTGGRRLVRMLTQFTVAFEAINLPPKDWPTLQGHLLVYIDGQVTASWNSLHGAFGGILDDLACTRASEAPHAEGGNWDAAIPKCTRKNTRCSVVKFFAAHTTVLQQLETALGAAPTLTKELKTILDVLRATIAQGEFPWEGETCRGVGDLLIGLQSRGTTGLISSNKKEHSVLAGQLGYAFLEFPISDIRSK